MAKGGGGKNAILLIVVVAAIGGAIYFYKSMMPKGNEQYDQVIYYIDPESVMKDPQVTAKIKTSELKAYSNKQLVDDPAADERLVRAGICGHCGKYMPLVGHGGMPTHCPVCKKSLEGFDANGNPLG